MPDTSRYSGRLTRGILILILLTAALLASGCSTSSPALTDPGSGTPVRSGTTPCPADNCTGADSNRTGVASLSKENSCYFSTHGPMDFLDDLRMHPLVPVTVLDIPDGWITKGDVALLMQEIDSEDPAAPVISPLSSYWPFNQTSTVGNEALFLIEGYRTGKYPPRLCSLYYFRPDRSEVRLWWESYGRPGRIEEQDAIRALQRTYPDLLSYPSDGLPPRSIRTEVADDGWYIAFIQEGSGLPILSARCYHVANDGATRLTGMVNQSIMVLPADFSPKRCG